MSKFLLALTLNLCAFTLPFESTSSAFAQTQKVPVAILELTTKGGADPSEGNLLTDRIRSLVVKSNQYQVMERALVDKILKEQGFQSTQNCDGNESCSVRIGQLLSVKEIITGSLNKIGDFYTLTLRKIDVERGTILKEDFYDCRCSVPTLMVSALPAFINTFLQERGEEAPPQDLATSPPLREKLDPKYSLNIRTRKPWLIAVEGGSSSPLAVGILQYNFGDYFALYGGLGFSGVLGTKVYFNPHDWAVYMDLYSDTVSASVHLGTEYRHESGFTGFLSAGVTQSLLGYGTLIGSNAGLGYAF